MVRGCSAKFDQNYRWENAARVCLPRHQNGNRNSLASKESNKCPHSRRDSDSHISGAGPKCLDETFQCFLPQHMVHLTQSEFPLQRTIAATSGQKDFSWANDVLFGNIRNAAKTTWHQRLHLILVRRE